MDKRFTYLVEKYLDHNLDETEKVEFEKFLRDPLCSAYLVKAEKTEKFIEEGFRKIHTATEAEKKEPGQSEAEDFLEEIPEDNFGQGDTEDSEIREAERLMNQDLLNRGKRILFIFSGSVVGAALMWLVFFFSPAAGNSPQQLFKQYYKPYTYIALSSLKESTLVYNNAIVLYTGGIYSESARFCREYLSTETREPEVHFLYGLNLMELDSMQSAIQQFKAVTSFPVPKDGSLYVPAHWYSGLCYMALGKVDSALAELDLIKGIGNLYPKEVEELYNTLGKQK